jgi:hypothetical protein
MAAQEHILIPRQVRCCDVVRCCDAHSAHSAPVVSLSICPLLFTRDLSGLGDLACCSPSACRRGFPCLFLRQRTRRRSGGKVGIPLLLRDFQGTVGAVGNRFVVFHGFHGPVFSTARRSRLRLGAPQGIGVIGVSAHHMRTIPNRNRSIQVLVDRYRAAGQ